MNTGGCVQRFVDELARSEASSSAIRDASARFNARTAPPWWRARPLRPYQRSRILVLAALALALGFNAALVLAPLAARVF